MKCISVVIPVFNEVENVERAYTETRRVMEGLDGRYEFEIVFTDNHSTDGSDAILARIAAQDERVRVARFSKNFGYQQSIFTAYSLCSGDAAVQLDCDLQDPPDMIPEFLRAWEEGYAVVYGVRVGRREGRLTTFFRRVFYRLIDSLSEDDLPVDAGDFRLIDRAVIRELTRFQEYNPYLRGAIAWMGFRQVGIPYERAARTAGTTKFSSRQLISLAVDGILAHSTLPLRLATLAGVAMGAAAVLGAAIYMVGRFLLGQDWPAGFATIVLLLMLSISMTGFFLGIIGEYLNRMYTQSKGRPMTIIESSINIPAAPPSIRPVNRVSQER